MRGHVGIWKISLGNQVRSRGKWGLGKEEDGWCLKGSDSGSEKAHDIPEGVLNCDGI